MGILSFNGEAAASSAVFRVYPEVPFQNKSHLFKIKVFKKNQGINRLGLASER